MSVLSVGLVGRRLEERPRASAWRLVNRNYLAYKRAWMFFLTGFLEPVLYLFSIGVGVGQMIQGFSFNGQVIGYAVFVAPGMLAASAMNGAILDSTYNIFFKLKYDKLYESVLATPMRTTQVARGEIAWALLRSGVYSAGFLVVMAAMGYVYSWWAVLALPATLLIGLALSRAGMALTTFTRSWQDFGYVTRGMRAGVLCEPTLCPVGGDPGWLRWIVECTPLYRGVVLCRELTTGAVTWGSAVSVVYLVLLGLAGLAVVSRRLDKLLRS
jgi:lipooligosaccharide transport system permease protein